MGLTPTHQTLSTFLSPIAINGLLTYLGQGGKDAIVRPWAWIFLLFSGPLVGSIAMQWSVHSTKTNPSVVTLIPDSHTATTSSWFVLLHTYSPKHLTRYVESIPCSCQRDHYPARVRTCPPYPNEIGISWISTLKPSTNRTAYS